MTKKQSDKKKQSRGFCFTINNYTDDDIAALMAIYEKVHAIKYLCMGFEEGSRKETPHIQGYIYYTNPTEEIVLRHIFSKYMGHERTHTEFQKSSTNVAAYSYCCEDGDWIEYGERPRQGHRTDLSMIRHDLLHYKDMTRIQHDYFSQWCQYRRSFDEFSKLHIVYNTELYVYDAHDPCYSFPIVYSYPREGSYYVDGLIFPLEFYSKFFSGQYKRVFVPNNYLVEDLGKDFLEKNVTRYIVNDGATTTKREEQILKEVYKETTDSDSDEGNIEYESDSENPE